MAEPYIRVRTEGRPGVHTFDADHAEVDHHGVLKLTSGNTTVAGFGPGQWLSWELREKGKGEGEGEGD